MLKKRASNSKTLTNVFDEAVSVPTKWTFIEFFKDMAAKLFLQMTVSYRNFFYLFLDFIGTIWKPKTVYQNFSRFDHA